MLITEAVTNTIISVAGILGTVVMGSIGLHFTARSRTSPNRQVLYTKQIELTLKIFRASGVAVNLTIMLSPESEHHDYAREELRAHVAELSQLSYEAAILFPVEAYVAFKKVPEALVDVVTEYDEGRDTTASFEALQVADTRWALMARSLIGADELSIESLQLHSKKNALDKLSNVDAEKQILQAVRAKINSSKSTE
jgi:hypothetical protein